VRIVVNGHPREARAVQWEDDAVLAVDQRMLPDRVALARLETVDAVADAIRTMIVRGAPTIGATAAYGMALAAIAGEDLAASRAKLAASRPTARDLFAALAHMDLALAHGRDPLAAASGYADDVVARCVAIGEHGLDAIPDGARVLTHCHAGALAAVDVGTALAPIRLAHASGRHVFAWVDETRPRLQGRITAWELAGEGIPHALIADNAAGHFMARGEVDVVIVGADRIAANGDVANKIGTYTKAVLAQRHGIPFYVAAPRTTFDAATRTGADIPIEERDAGELGGGTARNPAFDVTPAGLVTGYVTEAGILRPEDLKRSTGLAAAWTREP